MARATKSERRMVIFELKVRNMPKDSDKRFVGFLKDMLPAFNYVMGQHYKGFAFNSTMVCDIQKRHLPGRMPSHLRDNCFNEQKKPVRKKKDGRDV